MKKLLILIVLMFSLEAEAVPASPWAWPECLPRNTIDDVRQAGAQDWEVLAIRAITRDGLSKGPVDLVPTDCGAHGWAHFSPGRLDLNIATSSPCPVDDAKWRQGVQLVLYSDGAGWVQLRAWRRIVGPAVREARRNGWRRSELALAAALANSSPSLLRRLGAECDWDSTCVRRRYGTTDHRRRRLTFIEQEWP